MTPTFPDEITIRGECWHIFLDDDSRIPDQIKAAWISRQSKTRAKIRIIDGQVKRGKLVGLTFRSPWCIIVLHNNRDAPWEMTEALIHELLHACVDETTPPITTTQEEEFISHVQQPLCDALSQLNWS